MKYKLSRYQKRILLLLYKEENTEGWAKVSKAVFPVINEIPKELIEAEVLSIDGSGRARLTDAGRRVIFSMDYL